MNGRARDTQASAAQGRETGPVSLHTQVKAVQDLEAEINSWLQTHPHVAIEHVYHLRESESWMVPAWSRRVVLRRTGMLAARGMSDAQDSSNRYLDVFSTVRYVGQRTTLLEDPGELARWPTYSTDGSVPYEERLRRLIFESKRPRCPFCGSPLRSERWSVPYGSWPETLLGRLFPVARDVLRGLACLQCGWWVLGRMFWDADPFSFVIDHEFAVGVHSVVDVADYDGPIDGLRTHLSRHPEKLTSLSPQQFERLVAACLRDAFPNAMVHHVGGTGDRGIDILIAHGGRRPAVVQVKRRGSLGASEGVQVVRELHGVMYRDGLSRGIVVSTAGRYTRGAIAEVEGVRQHLLRRYDTLLLTRHDFAELLLVTDVVRPRPWAVFDVAPVTHRQEPAWPTEPYLLDSDWVG